MHRKIIGWLAGLAALALLLSGSWSGSWLVEAAALAIIVVAVSVIAWLVFFAPTWPDPRPEDRGPMPLWQELLMAGVFALVVWLITGAMDPGS